jgi:hypothetical protein
MPIINEHGEEWVNLPLHRIDQTAEIAFFLNQYYSNKTVLLIQPTVVSRTSIKIAKKLNADVILQEQASHCVELVEPTFANNWDIPFYYLSNNLIFLHDPVPGILFYPYWLLASRRFPNNNLVFGSSSDINRKYTCASICRHPRDHRIYNFIKLQKKPYFNKIYWTFWKCDHISVSREMLQEISVTDQEWKQFSDYYENAAIDYTGEMECITLTNWDAFLQSYINLTSETYQVYNFTSEKSFKPFLSGQIPMIFGAKNANKFLSDMGFDMFYDIVNHKTYDTHENLQDRLDNLHKCVDTIIDLDFSEIFKQTAERRKKNKDHLFSRDVEQLLMKSFFEKLQHC